VRKDGGTPSTEDSMADSFRRDVDAAMADATRQGKPILLDFSAAPM
jgi:hypothetical protein